MDEQYRKQERERSASKLGSYTPTPVMQTQCVDEKGTDRAYQAPMRERVDHRLRQTAERAEDLHRIRQMLVEHPEFEQFLELQALINRQGL